MLLDAHNIDEKGVLSANPSAPLAVQESDNL